MPEPIQKIIPRWRGFNLPQMYNLEGNGDWNEDDFRWMADWGFDFVRLPLCYSLWIEDGDIYKIHKPALEKIDYAIELGKRYGLHICLNFHRAPGYSVNYEKAEPFCLWTDRPAQQAFCFHWEVFAKRYAHVPSERLSFNLINEPPLPGTMGMTRENHARVILMAVSTIRKYDSDRLIIVDGVTWAREACPELAYLDVAQSCRAYSPLGISHYKASWVFGEYFPEPAWPNGWELFKTWDRSDLENFYAPWINLARKGIGVHCGEGGAYSCTPHKITLSWLRDVLEILTDAGIGYALWNFRGDFGILDSNRKDVKYEDWHGHKLDRKLLSLLQEF